MNSTRQKLTQNIVAKAVAAGEAGMLFDKQEPGLMLRIGKKKSSWCFQYKPYGRRPCGRRHNTKTLTLGTFTAYSLAEARRHAARFKVRVAEGEDPARDKQLERAAKIAERDAATTLSDEVENYIRLHLKGGESHIRAESSSLKLGLKEMSVGALPPGSLSTNHIYKMLDANHGRAVAKHRYGAWDRFCEHLLSRDIIPQNPCAKIPRRNRPKPPAPRTRVYSAQEIQALMRLGNQLGGTVGRFLCASVMMPFRFGELAELRADEVDWERKAIVLPGKRTKNGDPFMMPLSNPALKLLDGSATGRDRIFQLAPGGGEFRGHSKLNKRLREQSEIADFGFHHLRRTFATTLSEHSVGDAMLADALLNHRQSATKGGIVGVYNQSKNWPQKVRLMDVWARFVETAEKTGRWSTEEPILYDRHGPSKQAI